MKDKVLFFSLLLIGFSWSLQAGEREPKPVIVIDAGHGGEDPGALARRVREKDVVLALAKKLAARLKKNAVVYLTRNDDRTLTLERRDQIANQKSCDLFLSLHANAANNQRAHGLEVYYLNKATDQASRRLASRENRGTERHPRDIDAILSDLIQTAATEASAKLAARVQKSLVHQLGKSVRVKTALFYVLVGAKCPSLLIETGFITHRQEAQRLKQSRYQRNLANAIAAGVEDYLNRSNEEGEL